MPLYCTKCQKELRFVTFMQTHVTTCWGDLRFSESFSPETWKLAQANPSVMADTYFTMIDPSKLESECPQARDVIWDALFHPGVRTSVQEQLKGFLHNPRKLIEFDWANFQARLDISGTVANENIYYRKMSQGEWDASQQGPRNEFNGAFNYTKTANYRLWMSSSLKKVQAFGNENSSDAGEIIAKIEFNSSPLVKFKNALRAHQEQGVQGDSSLIAIHREGFAEIGVVGNAQDLEEIIDPNPKLDFNIGFTADQSKDLTALLKSFTRV